MTESGDPNITIPGLNELNSCCAVSTPTSVGSVHDRVSLHHAPFTRQADPVGPLHSISCESQLSFEADLLEVLRTTGTNIIVLDLNAAALERSFGTTHCQLLELEQ